MPGSDDQYGTEREVRRGFADDGSGEVAVTLRRSYPVGVEDAWSAVSQADQLERWFLPLSGDLRVGGRFQLSGRPAGRILACDPPRMLRVSFGDDASVIEARLSPEGPGATRVHLEHTIPVGSSGSGAEALGFGSAWEVSLVALGRFLDGAAAGSPVEWEQSAEAQRLSNLFVEAWAAVVLASGAATADEIDAFLAASAMHRSPGRTPDDS